MEQVLRIDMLPTLVGEVRATIHLTPIARFNGEVIRNVDTVVEQFHLDVAIKQSEVDTFLQRLVGGCI